MPDNVHGPCGLLDFVNDRAQLLARLAERNLFGCPYLCHETDCTRNLCIPPCRGIGSIFRLLAILDKLKTKPAFNAEMAVCDADVERRCDLHNAIVLGMESQCAADTTVRTNGVGFLLVRFVPGTSLAHVVFGFEHQRAGGTDADAVSAVDTSGGRQTHAAFRRGSARHSATRVVN